jgi:hypothetical protein
MEWINKHKNVRQVPVLLLLLLAIAGPWFFTLDGVPPPEWCRDPFFLLSNGLCAGSVSAAEILAFIGSGILAMGAGLVSGAVAVSDIAAELPRIFLIAMLLLVLVLPILSTLLLVAGRDSRRVRVFYLITWGLAAVLSLLPVVFDATLRSVQFWGIWLYLGLAAGVLVLEILVFAAKSRSGIAARL